MRVWHWITHVGGVRATFLIAALILVFAERKLGLAVITALLIATVLVQALKRAYGRPRPRDEEGNILARIKLPDPFSFPSGHTAAATAIATTVCLYRPALTPVLLPLAALVGASRVILRVHFKGDVLAGATIGLLSAFLGSALFLY
jgi:undecaprenyl-diphosphatase